MDRASPELVSGTRKSNPCLLRQYVVVQAGCHLQRVPSTLHALDVGLCERLAAEIAYRSIETE